MAREYYSIPEAAARLGLSRIAVFKKVKKGQLEALRIGRNWAVPAAALERAAAPKNAPAEIAGARRAGGLTPGRKVIPPRPAPLAPKKDLPPPSLDSELDSMGWD
ncbi:MAG: excisionase family DNA-binding protein [Elusimicrobiota bacterium]|nr:excisionase family DNA-binding protein [Elusimicrobiota bacterium]